ncbi:UDP-N-acetylmuramoyl-tripeptide--D-alanyl-D-alanine ligase [Bacillus ndiopicus]|uniref:UDP-N-acetylmuramoyl-tripeptide--D-alanyl-D- alanine ligase n=1 Tax=Bacillus ndiopicus TaxID=1347368 RepID=UPI0005AB938C|nr:UDP-N-acetylmuramoyl-tripeptide--D-alanyl-D-alanine ligase [Bacillus ndiopicus]
MKKTIKQLAAWLKIDEQSHEDVVVTGISIDTRTIQTGDLFVPFRGESVNGHKFVEQAFEKGAAASLWLKDEPNPPENRPLIFVDDAEQALQQMAIAYRSEHKATFIGITGSNGKTSAKDIVASALAPYFKVQKTIGNLNNQLGLPITILQLAEDTEVSVLEMGMSGFGEIELLSRIARPHLAIITNIGEAHMQDLGSRAGIAQAKYEITQGLLEEGFLIYDGDEPLLRDLVAEDVYTEAKAFGFDTEHELYVTEITTTEKGSSFTVNGLINGEFAIPILGKHQVKNTLAAMLICRAMNLTDEQIGTALAQIELTDMRMQLVEKGPLLFINDAYNAAPTSMRAAIDFMQTTTIRPEKWLVLGDMLELGDDEQAFHENIAQYIDKATVQYICLYGSRMKWLYEKLSTTFDSEHLIYSEEDYMPIAQKIQANANEQSIILLKGSRGMKLETILEHL